jgi:two-component system, cell cycle sensor histidine kinase and response regulator CckA
MRWMTHPYTISLFAASVISLVLAGSAWKSRTTIKTRSFSALMLAVSLWSTMHVFELAASTFAGKIFWANMQFFCIVSVPPALLFFVIRYTRRDHLITASRRALILSVPLCIVALVWTNGFHGWVFTRAEIVQVGPFALLYRHFGTGFWIHTGYCYAVMMAAAILLVRSLVSGPPEYREQVFSLLVGVAVPWIGNIMYLFDIPPFSDFDMTPVVFTISGLAFGWGVFRYRLLDIVPIAYDLMLDNMQDAVFVFDRHQRVVDLNPAAVGLTGRNRKSCLTMHADLLIPGWPDMAVQIENGGRRQQVCMEKQNQDRYFDLIGTPLKHDDQLFGYLVVLRDVTDSRYTQLALAESEKQFKSLNENAPIVICTLNPQGLFSYVNPEWENVLGHSREGILGRHFSNFVLPHYIDDYTRAFTRVRDKMEILSGLPVKLLHRDGSRRFFSISASPNLDGEGKISNVICLLKDQTGERELQAQLFQSQKMEAIGTLAGGIAHDFNNLLMGIQANVSLLRMENNQGKKCLERIDSVERQIQTGASLTRQLLGYARKGKYRPTPLCLNALIQEALTAFGRTRKALTIRYDLFEALPRIQADRGQMELVLLNLLINASDAMPDGGTLTASTDVQTVPSAEMQSLALGPGNYVHLRISDTGIGMDKKTQERIFEPFFTTKAMGRGTGLGMASVYGVVKNHNGVIAVSSKPGEGTTFDLYFQAAMDACPAPAQRQALRPGSGRILFVDDEPELLRVETELMERIGYRVTCTQSSFEALQYLTENPGSFDLVIIDMIMPGMGGRELYGHIRRLSPEMRILFSTGFGDASGTADLLRHDQSDIICKPYTAEALSQKIISMLGGNEITAMPSCAGAS